MPKARGPEFEPSLPELEADSSRAHMSEAEVLELITVAQKEYEGYLQLNDELDSLPENDQQGVVSEYESPIGLVIYAAVDNAFLVSNK
jgi:hypothetical protein